VKEIRDKRLESREKRIVRKFLGLLSLWEKIEL
jgi:hypothetical protein